MPGGFIPGVTDEKKPPSNRTSPFAIARTEQQQGQTITAGRFHNVVISGKLTMPGTAAALAAGATPPTAANTGTGLWLDRTGLYGVVSNVQKFILNAATGALTATDATITGAVTATSGTIGGFTVGATELYAGTGATRVELQTTGGIWAGATAFADAPFRVSPAGALTATSATITGAITASSGSITGTLTMPGAGSAIAIGATPPTGSATGTGIWIDRTGLYSLLANTYQVKIDATTGKLYAGGGSVTLDANGLRLASGAGGVNFVQWYNGVTLVGAIYTESDGDLIIEGGNYTDTNGTVTVRSNYNYGAGFTRQLIVDGTGFTMSGSVAGSNPLVVSGTITGTQLISNIAVGTAPLVVTSTTKVTNLNAEQTDGYDAAASGATAHLLVTSAAGGAALDEDARIGGGLYVGSTATDPAAGAITCTGIITTTNTGDYQQLYFIKSNAVNTFRSCTWSKRNDTYFGNVANGFVLECDYFGAAAHDHYVVPIIFNPNGDILLASASNATNGDVYVGTDLRIGGGLYVGSTATDPGADNVEIDGVFKVGGNQVVGARGAHVADPTDLATCITAVKQLCSRLETHGLLATS